MKISELAGTLDLEPIQTVFADREVAGGYCSDLLSDVMAKASADAVLVTIQAHKNTVAVASLVGLAAIVICNSRIVPFDMIEAAKAEGVAVFRTDQTQFEISGRLWTALRGGPLRN